jgi:hypothetical protein
MPVGRCGGRNRTTDEVTMPEADTGRFTVGAFKDLATAEAGIGALARQGFPPESLSIIAKEGAAASDFIQQMVGKVPAALSLPAVGEVLAAGSLISALEGDAHDLARVGLAQAMKRAGFQTHEGQIFEKLTERGGVIVAVRSEARAADALATLHCYGGGNATIGAWTGRL